MNKNLCWFAYNLVTVDSFLGYFGDKILDKSFPNSDGLIIWKTMDREVVKKYLPAWGVIVIEQDLSLLFLAP